MPCKEQTDSRCWACDEPRHSKFNDRSARAKHCAAWNSTCEKCSIKGHLTRCCSKCTACSSWGHRDKQSPWCPLNPRSRNRAKKKTAETLNTEDDETSAVYDQLCALETRPIIVLVNILKIAYTY